MHKQPYEQRSKSWIEWRLLGCGASESSILVNMNPYNKTPITLWEEKTGRSLPSQSTYAMQHGIDTEEEAREAFQAHHGHLFLPLCADHRDYYFIKASFDGVMINETEICEIKCPTSSNLFEVVSTGSEELLKETYPHYWCQCQHQLSVNEKATVCHFVVYQNKELAILEIKPNKNFIEKTLIPAIQEFWTKYVVTDEMPPLSDKDYEFVNSENLRDLARDYQEIDIIIKEAEEKKKFIRDAMLDYGNDGNFVGGGLRFTRVKQTRTDYKAAALASGIDLNPYVKEGIGYYKITSLKS